MHIKTESFDAVDSLSLDYLTHANKKIAFVSIIPLKDHLQ